MLNVVEQCSTVLNNIKPAASSSQCEFPSGFRMRKLWRFLQRWKSCAQCDLRGCFFQIDTSWSASIQGLSQRTYAQSLTVVPHYDLHKIHLLNIVLMVCVSRWNQWHPMIPKTWKLCTCQAAMGGAWTLWDEVFVANDGACRADSFWEAQRFRE